MKSTSGCIGPIGPDSWRACVFYETEWVQEFRLHKHKVQTDVTPSLFLIQSLTLLDFLISFIYLFIAFDSVCGTHVYVMYGGPRLMSRIFLDDHSLPYPLRCGSHLNSEFFHADCYQTFSGIPSLPLVHWNYTRPLHLPGIYLSAGDTYWFLCLHIKHLCHSGIFLILNV